MFEYVQPAWYRPNQHWIDIVRPPWLDTTCPSYLRYQGRYQWSVITLKPGPGQHPWPCQSPVALLWPGYCTPLVQWDRKDVIWLQSSNAMYKGKNKQMRSKKINSCFGCVLFIHVACLWMCILFYSSFVCLYMYAYDFKSKVHCGSALGGPGASRLLYYCVPRVCVPASDVIGWLAASVAA